MARLRVVHLTPTYFNRSSVLGGGERYALELSKALSRYVDSAVLTFSGKPPNPPLDSLVVRRPLGYLHGNKLNPIAVGFLRDLKDADIIHCHQVFNMISGQATLFGTLTRKMVFLTDLGGGGTSLFSIKRMYRLVDGFLCVSEHSAERFRSLGRRIEVVGAGVDTKAFRPASDSARDYLLCVARIAPHKGQDVLISGMPEDARLHIVGSVGSQKYLDYLIQMAEGKSVEFLLELSDKQLVSEYQNALVTILPSVYHDAFGGAWTPSPELFGLCLVESMACGTPVVASRAGGIPEVVDEGVTGYLVRPGDPLHLRSILERLINDRELVDTIGRQGRETVLRRFTWDHVARRCLGAYSPDLSHGQES